MPVTPYPFVAPEPQGLLPGEEEFLIELPNEVRNARARAARAAQRLANEEAFQRIPALLARARRFAPLPPAPAPPPLPSSLLANANMLLRQQRIAEAQALLHISTERLYPDLEARAGQARSGLLPPRATPSGLELPVRPSAAPGASRPILLNPSQSAISEATASTGRRLIGVRIAGNVYFTPELPGSSHRVLGEAVGSNLGLGGVPHTRLVVGLESGGRLHALETSLLNAPPPPPPSPVHASVLQTVEQPRPAASFSRFLSETLSNAARRTGLDRPLITRLAAGREVGPAAMRHAVAALLDEGLSAAGRVLSSAARSPARLASGVAQVVQPIGHAADVVVAHEAITAGLTDALYEVSPFGEYVPRQATLENTLNLPRNFFRGTGRVLDPFVYDIVTLRPVEDALRFGFSFFNQARGTTVNAAAIPNVGNRTFLSSLTFPEEAPAADLVSLTPGQYFALYGELPPLPFDPLVVLDALDAAAAHYVSLARRSLGI